MTRTERRNEITRLAAQEAAMKQNTADLAMIYGGLEQEIDETTARKYAVERELRMRYLEAMPQHTKVRILVGDKKGSQGFIRGIQGLTSEGRPIWTLWRCKIDGTESVHKHARGYHERELERER